MEKLNLLKKKLGVFFIIVVGITLFFSSNVSATKIFLDMPTWAEKEISYLKGLDVVKGYSNGAFGTNDYMKRSEAAVMLVRAKKLENEKVPSNSMFSDIRKGSFYYEAVQIAASKGYINGFSDGTFRPNETLTRGQMAKIISVAYNLKAASGKYFTDTSNSFANEYINGLATNGITNGYSDRTFKPNNNIIRIEFSIMLARAMNNEFKVKVLDPITTTVPKLQPDPGSGTYVIPGAPTSFPNCTAMKKYYPNGVKQGHPAYSSTHDRDKDGWACE